MVKDDSDSERGNPLPQHGLIFPISSKVCFDMHHTTDMIAHTTTSVTCTPYNHHFNKLVCIIMGWNEWMFNDTPAQKFHRLLGVRPYFMKGYNLHNKVTDKVTKRNGMSISTISTFLHRIMLSFVFRNGAYPRCGKCTVIKDLWPRYCFVLFERLFQEGSLHPQVCVVEVFRVVGISPKNVAILSYQRVNSCHKMGFNTCPWCSRESGINVCIDPTCWIVLLNSPLVHKVNYHLNVCTGRACRVLH